MSPHELRVNVIVHDGGLAEQEAGELRARVREVEQRSRETERRMQERIEEFTTELRQLKALVPSNSILTPLQ